MKNITYLLIAFLSFSLHTSAQKRKTVVPEKSPFELYSDSILSRFALTLKTLQSDADSGVTTKPSERPLSPYLYKITGPAVYRSQSVASQFVLDYATPDNRTPIVVSDGMLFRDNIDSTINRSLVNLYMTNPTSIVYYDGTIFKEQLIEDAKVTKSDKKDISGILVKADSVKNVKAVVDQVKVDLVIEKPNFWKHGGKFGLQFNQNYNSKNWYKGGNPNINFLSSVDLYLNYNDQHKIQWDNSLELKLGFVTTTDDTIHSILTNNDRINLKSKLGLHAFKKFYYTMSLDTRTQFLPSYKTNDTTVYARCLAPLDLSLSIGLDYKPTWKIGTFSVALLPFSYKLRYVNSDDEAMLKYNGMKDGKKASHDFGSRAEMNLNFQLFKNFYWKSRFYYFTSYKFVESEWENTFSYTFAKHFSAEVYTIWRFDDQRNIDEKDMDALRYFQFKEFFSLGLTYSF